MARNKPGRTVVTMTRGGDRGDEGAARHIPGANGYHTLCGWCDCPGAEVDLIDDVGEPNCHSCLEVLRQAMMYRRFA